MNTERNATKSVNISDIQFIKKLLKDEVNINNNQFTNTNTLGHTNQGIYANGSVIINNYVFNIDDKLLNKIIELLNKLN